MVPQHDKVCSPKSLGHVVRKRSIHSTVCVHNLYDSIHHMILTIVGSPSTTRCRRKEENDRPSHGPNALNFSVEDTSSSLLVPLLYVHPVQFIPTRLLMQPRSTLTTAFVPDLHSMHNYMSSKVAIASRFNATKQPFFSQLLVSQSPPPLTLPYIDISSSDSLQHQ